MALRNNPDRSVATERGAPDDNVWGLTRTTFAAGIAAVLAGVLVGGIGSRIFMRLAGAVGGSDAAGRTTEAGFTVGEITLGGTIALIVFTGLVAGLVGAVVFLAAGPWLSWAGRLRGVAFGVLLFGLTSASSDVMNPDNFDFLILGNGPTVVALIASLFLMFGVVMDSFVRFFEQRLPQAHSAQDGGSVYLVLSILGAVFALPLTVFILFTEDACGCAVPLGASVSFVAMACATVVRWIGRVRTLGQPIRVASGVLGWAGLLGVAGFGITRAISDAVAIIRLG